MSFLKKLISISLVYKNNSAFMCRSHAIFGLGMRLSLFLALLVISWPLGALERHSDPDGCFSCHGLPALEYIDEEGMRRTASILQKDYFIFKNSVGSCFVAINKCKSTFWFFRYYGFYHGHNWCNATSGSKSCIVLFMITIGH